MTNSWHITWLNEIGFIIKLLIGPKARHGDTERTTISMLQIVAELKNFRTGQNRGYPVFFGVKIFLHTLGKDAANFQINPKNLLKRIRWLLEPTLIFSPFYCERNPWQTLCFIKVTYQHVSNINYHRHFWIISFKVRFPNQTFSEFSPKIFQP